MSKELIRLTNLTMTFEDGETILDNINLYINNKEFLTLLGPSGCGKTTMLRIIGGFLTPTSGDVLFNGQRINDVPAYKRKINTVFQRYALFPHLDVYDNIAFGPRTHGIHKKAVLDEIVEKSLRSAAIWDEVKDRLNKSALGMSGGQQQRLCIARALAVEPEVLLMDEPTSALDPISTSKVEELATELKENYTIVMVTHNMQQAARISDKTAFFLLGELVEMGPTERVFATPVDKRTEDYISGRFG